MKTNLSLTNRRALSTALVVMALAWQAVGAAPAWAAPSQEPEAGGTITVNSTGTGNVFDSVVTLTEAILIANGGTSGAGLNRPLMLLEMAQLSGCTFVGGLISGGCGQGYMDTIVFTGLNAGATIYLSGEMPDLDDDAGTFINGSLGNIFPTIRRDPGFNDFYTPLKTTSDNNFIQGIGFEGDACGDSCGMFNGIEVHGDFNHFSNVWVWKALNAGILVWSGTGDVFDGVRLGVSSPDDTVCWYGIPAYKGNGSYGLVLADLSDGSKVMNSWIGCNGDAGILVEGVGNIIGPNNHIGTNTAGTGFLGNLSDGVYLHDDYNIVISNTVAYNADNGIDILSGNNKIGGNVLRGNNESGLRLFGPAQGNLVGGPQVGMPYGGNQIGGNGEYGVELIGLASLFPHDNHFAGNRIGTLNGIDPAPNSLDGILLDGAYSNTIGQAASPANIIGGNSHHGVRLANGAYDNLLVNNFIGANGYTAVPNQWSGVRLESGAHDNLLGFSGQGNGNYVQANGQDGVVLDGSATANNLIRNNVINYNNAQGIRLANGAHDNTLAWNLVSYNGGAGINLVGAGTSNNMVDSTQVDNNGVNGIRESNGASNNWWVHLSSHDNGGAGIVKSNAMAIPTIVTAGANGGQVTVQGTASPDPGASGDYLVELYVASSDNEGLQYVGNGYTNGAGAWSITFGGSPGCFTAFQTWVSNPSGTHRSSEFATTYCVQAGQQAYKVYAPIVVRP